MLKSQYFTQVCNFFLALWYILSPYRVYFAVIFVFPGVISCIPFYNNSFGPSGAWW